MNNYIKLPFSVIVSLLLRNMTRHVSRCDRSLVWTLHWTSSFRVDDFVILSLFRTWHRKTSSPSWEAIKGRCQKLELEEWSTGRQKQKAVTTAVEQLIVHVCIIMQQLYMYVVKYFPLSLNENFSIFLFSSSNANTFSVGRMITCLWTSWTTALRASSAFLTRCYTSSHLWKL